MSIFKFFNTSTISAIFVPICAENFITCAITHIQLLMVDYGLIQLHVVQRKFNDRNFIVLIISAQLLRIHTVGFAMCSNISINIGGEGGIGSTSCWATNVRYYKFYGANN